MFIVLKYIVDFGSWLIVVEGTKIPAGEARQSRPRRHGVSRRLGGRPRKAKFLERKSTTMFNRLKNADELFDLSNIFLNPSYIV